MIEERIDCALDRLREELLFRELLGLPAPTSVHVGFEVLADILSLDALIAPFDQVYGVRIIPDASLGDYEMKYTN